MASIAKDLLQSFWFCIWGLTFLCENEEDKMTGHCQNVGHQDSSKMTQA